MFKKIFGVLFVIVVLVGASISPAAADELWTR